MGFAISALAALIMGIGGLLHNQAPQPPKSNPAPPAVQQAPAQPAPPAAPQG